VPGPQPLPRRDHAASVQDRVADAFRRHAPELRGYLTRALRDAELAADLTGDAFAKLVVAEQAGRFPDQPRAWLFRVGINLAASHGRHRRVETQVASSLRERYVEEPVPSVEQQVIGMERIAELREVLDQLAGDGRRALLLKAAGYNGESIARQIGRTNGATRTLMSRSRTPLRRMLLTREA
jgi:RNA polymerase sigma factor (sigma-70 family)